MKRRSIPPPGAPVNITSLCDIMLSLLIFFMLVSKQGIDIGADPELPLPVSRLGITAEEIKEEQLAEPDFIVLNVYPSLAGEQNPIINTKLLTTGEKLDLRVENQVGEPELQKFLETRKGDMVDFAVVLRADRQAPFEDIQPVLRAINAAGIKIVRYAIETPQGQVAGL